LLEQARINAVRARQIDEASLAVNNIAFLPFE